MPAKVAAKRAGIARMTVYRWMKAGKIKRSAGEWRGRAMFLVSLTAVRRLVGDGITAGRPSKARA